MLELCKKHQERIERVLGRLRWIVEAAESAYKVLNKLAPEKLPQPRELSEEELNEIFGSI